MVRKIVSDNDIRRLWNEGVSVADISKQFGIRGSGTISNRAKFMGLKPRRFKGMHKDRNAKICEMSGDSVAVEDIAATFGLSVKTVINLIKYGDYIPSTTRVKVSAASINAMIADAQSARDARI